MPFDSLPLRAPSAPKNRGPLLPGCCRQFPADVRPILQSQGAIDQLKYILHAARLKRASFAPHPGAAPAGREEDPRGRAVIVPAERVDEFDSRAQVLFAEVVAAQERGPPSGVGGDRPQIGRHLACVWPDDREQLRGGVGESTSRTWSPRLLTRRSC